MPNSAEHRAKYALNRAYLNTGLAATQPEWAAVVAFYAAVHLIERLAAAEPSGPVHHRTHTQREIYLRRHRQHRAVLTDYLNLQVVAEISRYGTVAQFNALHTAATVQADLIDTHLAAVEHYVAGYFAPPAPAPPPAPPGGPPSAASGS
jgi:hypothetical protein